MELVRYLRARRQELLDGILYSHLPAVPVEAVFTAFILNPYAGFGRNPGEYCWSPAGPDAPPVIFLYRLLAWDTAFFGASMARLQAVLFDAAAISIAALTTATRQFTAHLQATGIRHCYCEVAASDTWVHIALARNRWTTVETRLHYYHTLAAVPASRAAVREATAADGALLRRISAANRNPYDRFHADTFFSEAEARRFLGEYAAASVTGYCDKVLLPATDPVDSFMTISYLAEDARKLQRKLSRNVLTAAGPRNRGWHRRLLTEALWDARTRHTDFMLLTTQAANHAVIHNCEVTGFQLGTTTHTVSWQAPDQVAGI